LVPDQHVPNQDDSIAALENGLIQEGRAPVIASGQDDVVHLTSHLQDAQDVLGPLAQAMQSGQQIDPAALQSAEQYGSTMIPHVEAHLTRLQNDPMRKDQGKLFQEQFKQLVSFDQKLRIELRQAQRDQEIAQQQQQQATSLSALDQAKVQSIQTQTQLAAAKTQSQIQNQTAKTIHGIRLKALKQGQDMNLNALQVGHGIGLDTAKTVADIRNDRNKALAVPPELIQPIKKQAA
jgi:hypothetical protein